MADLKVTQVKSSIGTKPKPPRSNTTVVIPAALARFASSLPTAVAPSRFAPDTVMAFSTDDADARVRPVVSSMIWTLMFLFDRNTATRGRSVVPVRPRRTRL